MTPKDKKEVKKDAILTVRISPELDQTLDEICDKRRLTKAAVIREYLERARFFLIDHSSIKSLNENDLILLKRRFFKSIISKFDEHKQIEIGTELARFINDLARLQGKLDDVSYKLDLCEEYGLFPKFIDKQNYVLISKKFGPERFVEAFIWYLITKGDEGDYDKEFITKELEDSSKLMKKYKETIQPVRRDASHFAYEFAKIEEKK